MKSRLYIFIIFLFFVLRPLVFAQTSCKNIYKDVDSNHKQCGNIENLYFRGIGNNQECFFPSKFIKRDMAASWIVQALDFEENTEGHNFFDVYEEDRFFNQIMTLKNLKILQGYSDHTFKPYRFISRAEFVKLVANALLIKYPNIDENLQENVLEPFYEISSDDEFKKYIQFLYYIKLPNERRIFDGFSDNTFRPHKKITKASASKILSNLMIYLDLYKKKFDDYTPSNEGKTKEVRTLSDIYSKNVFLDHLVVNLGNSVESNPISAHIFGEGCETYLFVGAIHGSEYNSADLMQKWINELSQNQARIPKNKKIIVIPSLNPDGLQMRKRFNTNNVDLNRNFATNWSQLTYLGNNTYPSGGGEGPFSEIETKILRDFILRVEPNIIISYHSAAGFSIPNEIEQAYLVAQNYSELSGYSFTGNEINKGFSYKITGSLGEWAASLQIPSVVVELQSQDQDEFSRNVDAMWNIVNLNL